MRTTIAIDDVLVNELMHAEPGVSRSEAVRRAIKEYLRNKRIDEFLTLAGSGLVDVDWRDTERRELEEAHRTGHVRKRNGRPSKRAR
jgi:metal-responsive CopG/Arc/MetJ family transcriptional regulator